MAKMTKTRQETGALVARGNTPSALMVPGSGHVPEGWEARIQQYAKRDAATAKGAAGWPYISTKGGVFKVEETRLEELPPMIVLGTVFENSFFAGLYDADHASAPTCFAIGTEEENLAPPESLGDQRQCIQTEPTSPKCSGCWANVFGTGERGKGKACKNTRRLALLPADELSVGSLSQAQCFMLRLSVTSVKQYASYANKVARSLEIPLFMLRTRIRIEPDPKTQFKILFEPYDIVEQDGRVLPLLIGDSDLLTAIEGRVKEAENFLMQVPSARDDESEGAPKRRAVAPAPQRKPQIGRAGTSRKASDAPATGGVKRAATAKY